MLKSTTQLEQVDQKCKLHNIRHELKLRYLMRMTGFWNDLHKVHFCVRSKSKYW
jgi:hypothetical protein